MDRLPQLLKEEGYVIVVNCSDGDNKYYKSTTDRCQTVSKFRGIEQIARWGLEINNGSIPFGADMLRLLRNARVRLFHRRISMNVRYARALNVARLKETL